MAVVDENTVVEVGKLYMVNCAILQWINSGKLEYMPIHGPLHKDKNLGTDWRHYHIDGRFVRNGTGWGVENGITNIVIDVDFENKSSLTKFIGTKIKKRKCYFSKTGINPPELSVVQFYGTGRRYWKWYASMVGQSCKGKRCPHLGTKMDLIGDKLVCPLHKLIASAKTETVISTPESKWIAKQKQA